MGRDWRFGAVVFVAVSAAAITAAVLILTSDSAPDNSPRSGQALYTLAGHIAASDAAGGVGFFDYARARALAGIESPAPDASQIQLREYAEQLSLKTVMLGSPLTRFYSSSSVDWNSEVGFNFGDINQVMWTNGSPTVPSLTVAAGSFDSSRITQALQTSSSFSAVWSVRYADVTYLSWDKPPPINPIWFTAGNLIPGDELIVWSEAASQIERSIQAASERTISLKRRLTQVAPAFDKLGVYAAYLEVFINEDRRSANRDIQEGEYGRDLVRSQQELEPFSGIVVGVGQNGDDAYAVVILVHDDDAAARTNATRLKEIVKSGTSFHTRRPWKETIDKAEFEAMGTLVYGRIYSENLRLPFDAWNNFDSLFLQ